MNLLGERMFRIFNSRKARRLEAIEKRLATLETERLRNPAAEDIEARHGLAKLRTRVDELASNSIISAMRTLEQYFPGVGNKLGVSVLIISAIAAVATVGLEVWQASLMSRQMSLPEGQPSLPERQSVLQSDDRSAVRSQLLATLYDCRSDAIPICEPHANRRARAEAALALIGFENGNESIDLSGALLGDTDFYGETLLAGQNFRRACFQRANLRSADLSDTVLRRADFTDADLRGASFRYANLEEAVLVGVQGGPVPTTFSFKTWDATAPAFGDDQHVLDFTGATMLRADLRGADLRGARGLTYEQIAFTLGNADTLLPPGMRRPDGWE